MPQATNQVTSASKSGVKVRKTRTGCGSRSGGTATTISSAPISIPAALGKIVGKPSMRWVAGVRRGRDMRLLLLERGDETTTSPRTASAKHGDRGQPEPKRIGCRQ